MSLDSDPDIRPLPPRAPRPRLAEWVPLGFVLLSLLSLLAVPPLIAFRMSGPRGEISGVAEPARDRVEEIQLQLAREVSSVRGFLLTGDSAYLAEVPAARAAGQRAYEQLEPLAERLGPGVQRALLDLRRHHARWSTATEVLLSGRMSRAEYVGRVPLQQERYGNVLLSTARLGDAVAVAAGERRARIRAAARAGSVLTALLAILALASVVLLVRLRGRLRAQAGALARRAEEEVLLRTIARSLTTVFDIDEILQRIVAGALTVTDGDGAFVERADFTRDQVEVAAVTGRGAPPRGTRIPYPGSLAQEVIASGEPELVRDLAAESRAIAEFLPREVGRFSALVLPLISEEEAIGALIVLRAEKRLPFGAGEVAGGRTLADLAAVALRRAFLFHEAEQRARALEKAEQAQRFLAGAGEVLV